MLELPNLNMIDLDQMLTEARKQLDSRHPQWTDHSPHDPGITLLELLAFLTLQQHAAIDSIGPEHRKKFLALLNMEPESPRCAYTEILLTGGNKNTYLPVGSKLAARDVIFETLKRVMVSTNQLQGFKVEEENEEIIISLETEENRYRDWFAFGKKPQSGNCFYLFFKEPFSPQEELSFKFNVFEDYPIKRNPVTGEDTFSPLVKLRWEYFGEEKGVTGWHPLEVRNDTTHNLLFSGFITLQNNGIHLPCKHTTFTAYSFRCTLQEGQYDVPPRIKSILLNCIPLRQKETLSESYTFNGNVLEEDRIILDSYLSLFGDMRVFAKKNDVWTELESPADFTVEHDFNLMQSRVIPAQSLKLKLKEENSPVLKIVAREKSFTKRAVIGSSTGFINQEISMELNNIIGTDFKIMVGSHDRGGLNNWCDWHQVKTGSVAGRDEKCYELDVSTGRILFGDNRRGAVPPRGTDNLLITDCVLTRGSNGNIKTGKIQQFLHADENLSKLKIFQVLPSVGGEDSEDLVRAEQRLLKSLKKKRRAVNSSDFTLIAQSVPGLMVEYVKVLPLYKPGLERYPQQKGENCVTLVIEPYSLTGQGKLTPKYKENIMRYLEQFRLITTKIYVIEPTYVGLEIYGEIVVKDNYPNASRIIKDAVANYIYRIQREQEWRVRLSHGDIYGEVDLLECVSHIRYLSIEPVGLRVQKSNKGDITIPANNKFYLKSFSLTLLSSELY